MNTKVISRRSLPDSQALNSSLATVEDLIKQLYAARGYSSDKPTQYALSEMLPPTNMRGIAEGANIIEAALRAGERIVILGDFDADGATSTALAVRCLRAMGAQHVDYLVPNRFEFGYGLTPEIVAVAAKLNPNLIITVDNGIASVEGVNAANALGIKVLVTDHHLPPEQLPDAAAIVNPNQKGCEFGSKNLAGVGVIFYLLCALRSQLRASGWFEENGIVPPNMASYLDLVALGTVADVVPLDFNNRILVSQGIARMRQGVCIAGIRALFQVGGRNIERVQSTDLGFVVGPRLNAAGRLDDMSLGIKMLLTDNYTEALHLAGELDSLNRERRQIEASMQHEAFKLLDDLALDGEQTPMGVSLYQADWHQGVIGILASRIKDKLHRPTIAFADATDTEIKGSGRSVEGVHLRDILDQVATENPGLLSKFGGHAMAAGLSLPKESFTAFAEAFDRCVSAHLGGEALTAKVITDGELPAHLMDLATAEAIAHAGPWGQNFPEPLFDGEFLLVQQRIVGEKHLKMVVTPSEYSGLAIDAIAFNVDVASWPNNSVERVRLAYVLDVNEFRGNKSLQLRVAHLEALI
ncbi:single-stranded-DNA-specific exonuclease RecJ [Saccharophagus degradans]|uniref:single-stranded-DNA-specific exonuclease RecJ n=1 Tax=Saccharophagus degradans TaxID=86304 RepID=UPI002477EE9D|nr:single-stranded-DNA-specific exonuclease RecJ [Saccharophagus degradans]WGO97331.1 single-stranded-DNA-specific exonuclease RecJ [Saccharophagus degradans]